LTSLSSAGGMAETSPMISVRIIGAGHAGQSFAAALEDVGCDVRGVLTRGDDLSGAALGVDALLLATPDAVVSSVAQNVEVHSGTVLVHLSGSLSLDVLRPHVRRASLHPLAPLPLAEVGRRRLQDHIVYAVAGDSLAREIVALLGGEAMSVSESDRAAYHAAACIAANHVVGLMGQVARIAGGIGLELEPFVQLARYALDDVSALGPLGALTGPVARGDEETVGGHRFSLPEDELTGYDAGVALIRQLLRESASDT